MPVSAVPDFSKTVAAVILGKKVTQGALSKAFDLVAPKTGPGTAWKNPIDTEVLIAKHFKMLVIREAVIHMTGSVPTFTAIRVLKSGCVYRVKAAGYYATIGA
jgi:hypothetical protein